MRSEDPLDYFRPSRSKSTRRNALMATLQTTTLWGLFLWLFPAAILQIQARAGIARFDAGLWKTVAVCIFAAAGLTGWYCGGLFVKYGKGTPMPLDQTTQLVILGPYRFVRNPMAALGILQGLTVGVWLGSWPVVVYAILGGAAWHTLARPYEEADLERRFGAPYSAYRATIHNWMPTFHPYSRLVTIDEPAAEEQAFGGPNILTEVETAYARSPRATEGAVCHGETGPKPGARSVRRR